MNAPQRVEWIDAAKGLGIVLIVVGHVFSIKQPEPFITFIYAFHVPLFFFLSGLTLKPGRDGLATVVRKKARTLLLPYLVYALLGYAFYLSGYLAAQALHLNVSQFGYGLWPPLLGIAYGTIGDGNLVNAPVWFTLALFCTFLIGNGVNTWIKSLWLRWVTVLLLATLGYLASFHVRLPWSLSPALIALVFFQAGFDIHRVKATQGLAWQPRVVLLVLFTSITIACGVNGFVAMAQTQIGNPFWFALFAFSGTFMTILLVQTVRPLERVMAFIGRYSLSIMVIHMLIIKSLLVLVSVALKTGIADIDTNVKLASGVLALTCLILVPAVHVIERWFPWSIGKGKRSLTL